jgi:hypothetical protein
VKTLLQSVLMLWTCQSTKNRLDAWKNGALIQDVMRDLDEDQREFLISGMMPGEFEALFGEEE